MIVLLLINLIVIILGVIFSWLPQVTTLPEIGGYDIDTALSQGMGYVHSFFTTFWPLQIMFDGFLVLMLYYISMMTLRFFLGHRAPR